MSQHDMNIANQGFPAFRADLNDALLALGSTNSGATAPATTFANQLWYDTANNILKIRNEDNDAWISIATLDQSTDAVSAITAATLNATTVNTGALNTTGNTVLGDASTDTLNVGNGGLVKDASGNIGINNASPVYKLDLSAASGTVARFKSTGSYANIFADTSSATGGGNFTALQNGTTKAIFGVSGSIEGNTTGDAGIFAETGGAIRFYTNGSGVQTAGITTAGNLTFNSGFGSNAIAYGCRAWVNFDGTGTPSIRGSGNVSSLTDLGVGTYYVNFSNAMPDTNYCVTSTRQWRGVLNPDQQNTGSVLVLAADTSSGTPSDVSFNFVAIHR